MGSALFPSALESICCIMLSEEISQISTMKVGYEGSLNLFFPQISYFINCIIRTVS
jgi:hypothetical protein